MPSSSDENWEYEMAGCMITSGGDYLIVLGNKPLSLVMIHRRTGYLYKARKHESTYDAKILHNTFFATNSMAIVAWVKSSRTYVSRVAVKSKTAWEASISASHVAGVCEPRTRDNRVYIMGSSAS